jgi:hypothetical protein
MENTLEEIRDITWNTYKALESHPSSVSTLSMVSTVYETVIITLEEYWFSDKKDHRRRNTWERKTEELIRNEGLK